MAKKKILPKPESPFAFAMPMKDCDPVVIADAKARLEWAMGFMTIRYKFVYQILGMMVKTCRSEINSMGVRVLDCGKFELVFNPHFVMKIKDAQLTWVLYHEISHLVLHHCTLRKFDDHDIGNYAHDFAVNELIPTVVNSCERIPGTLSVSEWQKLPDFADIKEKQTAEWYYDYLMRKIKEGKIKLVPRAGYLGDHSGWKQDGIADEKIRAKINEIDKTNAWGDLGASEKELILAAQVRKINWRNLLRQFYGNMVWHEREATRKRPNRRTGYIHPGDKKIHVDRHLVAVDTSGSIDSDLLEQFLAVVNQMTEVVPIDIMQCDCAVTQKPKPFDKKQAKFDFTGRGGTDFQPIMDLAQAYKYKSVVILTDGCSSECTKAPNVAKVVWVLPEGFNPPVDWGLKVHMARHV